MNLNGEEDDDEDEENPGSINGNGDRANNHTSYSHLLSHQKMAMYWKTQNP